MSVQDKMRELCVSLGLYRPARVLYRHLLNREKLALFHRDLAFYAQFLKDGALCFDVGAHVGGVTELLLDLGARVVAFEPQPDCMRQLRARCGRSARLVARRQALGSEPSEATLCVRNKRACSSLLEDWEGDIESRMTVAVTTLDNAIAEFGTPVYCKIDVEGWEFEVLKGLTQPIPFLSFEYHLWEREIEGTAACLKYLSRLGSLTINVTPGESLAFRYDRWRPVSDFLKVWPAEFRGQPAYGYGDIFVHMV
ncbi:FkbM family methyltransferase [Planctomycetota bacterium]